MKYDYSVKANGKWYKPNEEISEGFEKIDESKERVNADDEGTSGKTKPRNTNK